MTRTKKLPLIVADPLICHGKPTFKGTRLMVWQVLELLEAGISEKEMYKSYPTLPKGAVQAALRYAAERAQAESLLPSTVHRVHA